MEKSGSVSDYVVKVKSEGTRSTIKKWRPGWRRTKEEQLHPLPLRGDSFIGATSRSFIATG